MSSTVCTQNANVLVVGDVLSDRRLAAPLLQKTGCHVTLVPHGDQAFEMIAAEQGGPHPYDLLIADLEMPDWNGIQLIDRLTDEGFAIPVLVATRAEDQFDLVTRVLPCQCHDCLVKPITPDRFVREVRRFLDTIESGRTRVDDTRLFPRKTPSRLDEPPVDYRKSYEELRAQTDSAVSSYTNLVNTSQGNCTIPFAWRNRPLGDLGGDFLDVCNTPTGGNFLIADVAGHDHGASYHTVLIKAFFAENCRTGKGGLTLMQTLNRQLLDCVRNDRMATALFLELNLQTMMGELVCAGHPPAIMIRKEMPIPLALHADGTVLGVAHDVRFDVYRFELTPGDRLFLYTDGVLDARTFSQREKTWRKLGVTGLKNIFRNAHGESIEQVVAAAWLEVLEFCDGKPHDDLLMAGIEIPDSPIS